LALRIDPSLPTPLLSQILSDTFSITTPSRNASMENCAFISEPQVLPNEKKDQ